MAHSLSRLLFHVVFSTKDREPFISSDVAERLFSYIGGIIRRLDGSAILVNGSSDHVHLLVCLPPNLALSDIMRVVKANSSLWANRKLALRGRFAWQAGYAAFTVSESNCKAVTDYIAAQQAHHRKVLYQREFLTLLKKHGVQFDERYMWK